MQDNQKTKMSAATDMVIDMIHQEQRGKALVEVGIKPKHQRNLVFPYFLQINTTSFLALLQPYLPHLST